MQLVVTTLWRTELLKKKKNWRIEIKLVITRRRRIKVAHFLKN